MRSLKCSAWQWRTACDERGYGVRNQSYAASASRRIGQRSFLAELDRQCERIIWFAALAALVVWLPYIPTDQELHPDVPAIVYLRLGLSFVGLLMIAALILVRRPGRAMVLLIAFGAYIQISTGVLTGLSGADPVYMGGYLFVLMLVPLGPMPRAAGWIMIVASLATFTFFARASGASFESARSAYSLKDLGAAGIVSLAFVYFADRLRRRSWEGQTAAFSRQELAERAQTDAEQARRSTEEARAESEKLNELSRKINSASSLENIVDDVFDHLASAYGFDGFMMMMPRKRENTEELFVWRYADRTRPAALYEFSKSLFVPLNGAGGLLERAFRRGKPVLVSDVSRDIFRRPYPGMERDRELVQTFMPGAFHLIPLAVNRENVAVIVCASSKPLDLDRHKRRATERLAEQIAGAVHLRNLLEKVEEEHRRAENEKHKSQVLADLARRANEGKSLDEVLAAVALALNQEFGADRLMLHVVGADKKSMKLRSFIDAGIHRVPAGLSAVAREIPLQAGGSIAYRTIEKMRSFYMPAVKAGYLKDNVEARAFLDVLNPTWLLVLPLMVKGEVEGLISCTGGEQPPLNREQRVFAESMAAQIAGTVRILRISDEKEKMATIGDMAAGIVHDLKNPVAIIKGSVEMAEEADTNASERTELHRIIDREADRMLSLVQDLLDFSRGSVSISKQKVGITDYLERVRVVLSPLFRARGVQLVIEDGGAGTVVLDPGRFLRVLVNIASNSADVLTEGGEFKVCAVPSGSGVLFTLSDNGPGIPESIREILFLPFSTHGKSHGTGLGMAIARTMVEAHGGTISFETAAGKGTTFFIEVPA